MERMETGEEVSDVRSVLHDVAGICPEVDPFVDVSGSPSRGEQPARTPTGDRARCAETTSVVARAYGLNMEEFFNLDADILTLLWDCLKSAVRRAHT